jgi:hypothetical protein
MLVPSFRSTASGKLDTEGPQRGGSIRLGFESLLNDARQFGTNRSVDPRVRVHQARDKRKEEGRRGEGEDS